MIKIKYPPKTRNDLQIIKNIQTRNEDYDKLKHNSKHNKIYFDNKKNVHKNTKWGEICY